jgi:hypothetical protein
VTHLAVREISGDKRASEELGYRFIAIGRAVEHESCFDD